MTRSVFQALYFPFWITLLSLVAFPACKKKSNASSSDAEVERLLPPSDFIASGAANEINLTWTEASGALGYNIYRSLTQGAGYEPLASGVTGSAYVDSTAVPGNTYYYVMESIDSIGTSRQTGESPAEAILPPVLSGVVINDTGGGGALVVSWSDSPGAEYYHVKYSETPGGSTAGSDGCLVAAPATSCVIGGLTGGTTYSVSVTAKNDFGGGAAVASAESSGMPIDPLVMTGAITLNATTGIIGWNLSNGANTYSVKYGTQSGSYPNTASADAYSPYTLTGLTPGATYYVVVTATNASGEISSTTESKMAMVAAPFAPTSLLASGGTSSVTLNWSAATGGGTPTYKIYRGPASGGPYSVIANGVTATTYTDLTALNGSTYYYVVAASNQSGTSPQSNEVSAKPIALPSIGSVAVSPSVGGALVLSWSAVTGASNYSIKYSTTSGQALSGTSGCSTSGTTCTVTGLTGGTSYYLTLVASNAVGSGASTSSAESVAIPIAAPSFTLTPGNSKITPNFSAAGAASFDLSYGTSTGVYPNSLPGASTGTDITGLVNGTRYYFILAAKNAYGTLTTAESNATPNGPAPFSMTSATPGDTTATIKWSASSGATGYQIKYGTASGSYTGSVTTGAVTTYTVTGLTNGTLYYFMVTATNANGTQNANAELSATPLPLPSLAWSPLTNDFGSIQIATNSTATTFTLSNNGNGATTGCSAPALSNTTDFSITADTCGTANLATGSSCTVSIRANPVTIGVKSATLTRVCTSSGGTASTTANGITVTGVNPVLAFSPLTFNFGNVYTGTDTYTKTFAFSNTGTGPGKGCSAPQLSDSTQFSITEDTCGTADLAAGASCSVTVRANPQSTGSKSTTLSRVCTTGGTVSTTSNGIVLTSIAKAPELAWAETTMDFGSVTVGKSGNTLIASFVNNGPASGTGCNAAILSNTTDFQVVSDSCSTNNAAPGSVCEIAIRAAPASAGIKNATLSRVCTVGGSITTAANGLSVTGRGTNSTTATSVLTSANSSHTCAVLSDGSVQCWGLNTSGQLGDGSTTNRATAVAVSGIGTAVAVATGGSHSCALLQDNSVVCWGSNASGQLGDGTTTNRTTPVAVSGINTAKAISLGLSHSCALLINNSVMCWGLNGSGQIGDNTKTNRSTPVAVTGLSSVAQVRASSGHTCALLQDGTAKCWGTNGNGEIGDGTLTAKTVPTVVTGLSGAASIETGTSHTCALAAAGTVKCWGLNSSGQLGDGTTTVRTNAVTITRLSAAASIALGSNFSCAKLTDNSVKCWGNDSVGQLGDGTTTNAPNPVSASRVPAVASITAGNLHACATLSDTSVKCWGQNTNSQLGDGTVPTRNPIAITVPGISTAVAATVGAQHTCALLSDQSVRCWGSNSSGQLGDGTTLYRMSPITASTLPQGATAIAAGTSHTCALLADGTVMCFGDNTSGQRGTSTLGGTVTGLTGVTAIASGKSHACALLTDKTLRCWGLNSSSQLGNGNTTNQPTPINPGVANATGIALGDSHSCALLADTTVKCWGLNSSGQLGDGTTTLRSTPVSVPGLIGVTAIYAGASHTCAVMSDKGVKCWGLNSSGQLGLGTTTNGTAPVYTTNISKVSGLATISSSTCALLLDGTVRCFGGNAGGQAGDRGKTNRTVPGYAFGFSGISALATGSQANHMCFVTGSQTLQCFGANDASQAGNDESRLRTVSGL